MIADGKVPFKACDVNAVNNAQGKVPDVQVVDVHDVLLIVLLVEVAIFVSCSPMSSMYPLLL